jgi:hypothetical protein
MDPAEIVVQTTTDRVGDIKVRIKGSRGGLVQIVFLTERQARQLVCDITTKLEQLKE